MLHRVMCVCVSGFEYVQVLKCERYLMTIQSFRDRMTKRLFDGEFVREFQRFERQARIRLTMLDDADSLGSLADYPGHRLEKLRGDRVGQYSIRINRQWRICFRWDGEGPSDVEIVDYH